MIMFSLLFAASAAITPVPQTTDAANWWQQRFVAKQQLVKAGGAPLVFLGDSITHFFEEPGRGLAVWQRHFAPRHALNLGFSADRTEHLLWRITQGGELDGYSAKAIVLMIGTNNAGHRGLDKESAADTIDGVRKVLAAIRQRQPKAITVLCAVFPRGEKADDPFRGRHAVVNRALKQFADGKQVIWVDFNDRFLLPNGDIDKSLMPDFLHPSEAGYEIWASAILPLIDSATTTQR